MGGFSRLQLSSIFILIALYLAGLGYREWIDRQALPVIDQNRIEQFQHVADSLNKIAVEAAKKKTRNKRVKKLTRKININTAPEQELIQLPGIGHTLAKRIIAYREKKGPFRSEVDIKKVRGIGEKKFLLIKVNIILR